MKKKREYRLIRSRRRTIGLEVHADALIVRAPLKTSLKEIDAFVDKNEEWIRKHQAIVSAKKEKEAQIPKLTMAEIKELSEKALKVIPERVRFYASRIGVSYGRITIRSQRTKWGSCSQKGNLNFNCLLMLAPPELLDSVVVHELCHIKYMNHSKDFYSEVERVFPDYRKWDRWLKENGHLLMCRIRNMEESDVKDQK